MCRPWLARRPPRRPPVSAGPGPASAGRSPGVGPPSRQNPRQAQLVGQARIGIEVGRLRAGPSRPEAQASAARATAMAAKRLDPPRADSSGPNRPPPPDHGPLAASTVRGHRPPSAAPNPPLRISGATSQLCPVHRYSTSVRRPFGCADTLDDPPAAPRLSAVHPKNAPDARRSVSGHTPAHPSTPPPAAQPRASQRPSRGHPRPHPAKNAPRRPPLSVRPHPGPSLDPTPSSPTQGQPEAFPGPSQTPPPAQVSPDPSLTPPPSGRNRVPPDALFGVPGAAEIGFRRTLCSGFRERERRQQQFLQSKNIV
jgi:hypothetical protein